MIEYIGGGHGCCVSHDHCGHHHHDDFLLKDTISNVEDLYDVLMTHISKKSIHTPKDEIIKLIDDSIDEALNSINDRDYLTIDEVRAEFEKLIKKQNFLTEIPDEYITESELSSEIDRRIRLLNLSQYLTVSSLNGYVKSSDLNEYAKHSWVTSLGYITKEQADAWYAKKGESSGNSTTYGLSISGQTLSLVKNGTT